MNDFQFACDKVREGREWPCLLVSRSAFREMFICATCARTASNNSKRRHFIHIGQPERCARIRKFAWQPVARQRRTPGPRRVSGSESIGADVARPPGDGARPDRSAADAARRRVAQLVNRATRDVTSAAPPITHVNRSLRVRRRHIWQLHYSSAPSPPLHY